MNQIIKDLYKRYKVPEIIVNKKMNRFQQNPDIADEFAYWVLEGQYKKEDPVTVEGYTAERLATEYPVLKGDGAFEVLMDLRENPSKTLARIHAGFKIK